MSVYIDKKFLNQISPVLEKFKWKKDNLANCRCPICGDSKKNPNKCRGFFFQKGSDYFYKCHNCGASHTLYKFLEIVAPAVCKEYQLERYRSGQNGKSNYKKVDEKELFTKFKKPEFKRPDQLIGDLVAVKDLPDNHFCRQFVVRDLSQNLSRFSRGVFVRNFPSNFPDFFPKILPGILV